MLSGNVLVNCYPRQFAMQALLVLALYFCITITLSIIGLHLHGGDLTLNPRMGFESRGSDISQQRLAFQLLRKRAMSPSEVLTFIKTRQSDGHPTRESKELGVTRKKRDGTPRWEGSITSTSPPSFAAPSPTFYENGNNSGRINEEHFDNGKSVESEAIRTPCDQYRAAVSHRDLQLVSTSSTMHLAENRIYHEAASVILAVQCSWKELFRLEPIRRLCRLDKVIDRASASAMEVMAPDGINHNGGNRQNFSISHSYFINPFSFHLPYYASCTDSYVGRNCSALSQRVVDRLRKQIEECVLAKEKSSFCKNERVEVREKGKQYQEDNPSSSPPDSEVCSEWNETLVQQLSHYILPASLWTYFNNATSEQQHPNGGSPIIYLRGALKLHQVFRRPYSDFDYILATKLLEELKEAYPEPHTLFSLLSPTASSRACPITLKGLELGARELYFERHALPHDICVAAGAVALVFFSLLWLQTSNAILTLVIMAGMLSSIGAAFFTYSCVFGIAFTPFISLIAVLGALVMGVSHVFLLLHYYRAEKRQLERSRSRYLNIHLQFSAVPEECGGANHFSTDTQSQESNHAISGLTNTPHSYCPEEECRRDAAAEMERNPRFVHLRISAVRAALQRTAMPIFTSSFTAAVVYAAVCLLMDIPALRCFGCFAALTTIFNLIFLMFALSAAILLLDGRPSFSCPFQCLARRLTRCPLGRLVEYHLPRMLARWFVFYTLISVALSLAAGYYTFTAGVALFPTALLLDSRAPMLSPSHPFEWYTQHYNDQQFTPSTITDANHSDGRSWKGDNPSQVLIPSLNIVWSELSPQLAGMNAFDTTSGADAQRTVNSSFKLSTLADFLHMERVIQKSILLLSKAFVDVDNEKVEEGRRQIYLQSMSTNSTTWLSNFLVWATAQVGTNDTCYLEDAVHSYASDHCFLRYIAEERRMVEAPSNGWMLTEQDKSNVSISKLQRDSPIFARESGQLLGYFVSLPVGQRTFNTQHGSSFPPLWDRLSEIGESINIANTGGAATLSTESKRVALVLAPIRLSVQHELDLSLRFGLPTAIGVAIAICAIVIIAAVRNPSLILSTLIAIATTIIGTFTTLLLIGWKFGAVELAITIIALALSFHHTLHAATAYRASPDYQLPMERLLHTYGAVGKPMGLTAISSMLVGAILLLLAETHTFIRIGQFLLAMSPWSWLANSICFPAMLMSTGCKCVK